MASNWINSDNMLRDITNQLHEQMAEAAEPVIRKAIEVAEKKMREQLAIGIMAILDQQFSIERCGHNLQIIVKHAVSKTGEI